MLPKFFLNFLNIIYVIENRIENNLEQNFPTNSYLFKVKNRSTI